jgi:hypothetical protein
LIGFLCGALGGVATACQKSLDDDDDSTPSNTAGTGASGAGGTAASGTSGSGGGGAMTMSNAGAGGGMSSSTGNADGCGSGLPPNLDCPSIMPVDGPCASAGMCCQRASNVAKEKALGPNDNLILEYRVQFSDTLNQAPTLGNDALRTLTTDRYNKEQQSLLFRFELPRKDGKLVAGRAKVWNGVGRYNCDGTYSYYGDTAAPVKDGFSTDAARWKPVIVEFDFDPAKMGKDAMHIAFADNKNRNTTYTPFLANTNYAYDWELINQGFDIKTVDFSDNGRECVGSRANGVWAQGGTYWIYTPNEPNNIQPISDLQGQTYCQLAAFGPFVKSFSCIDKKRCAPYMAPPPKATPEQIEAACPWKKLPDSLCPTTDEDKALWGCHLGDENNVNQEPPTGDTPYPTGAAVGCTQEKPTVAQDPDMGVTTTGQCCDPLGQSTTLPACNAYRLIQSYVLAAAEITDEPSNKLQQKCAP